MAEVSAGSVELAPVRLVDPDGSPTAEDRYSRDLPPETLSWLYELMVVTRDLDGLGKEVDDAVAVGFDAKVAIHPSQVAVIRAGYAPTPGQVDWARHVLAAARDERGVFQYEGIMVDAPVLRRAERIVQLAPHPGS